MARGAPNAQSRKRWAARGRNVLLAYSGGSLKRTGLYDRLRGWLHECGKHVVDFGGIRPNPTYAKVQEGARLVREQGIDFILAVGGGSVIDCCKIVSAQARTDEDIWDMMYEAHRLPTEFVPTGAVVTASGTGAEQNNGAVITHTAKRLKQPLVGAYHSFAILDSDLTKTLPMKQVVSGAFDTLSHCMETYMGRPQGDNLSDEINEAVMRSVIKNLRALIANPRRRLCPRRTDVGLRPRRKRPARAGQADRLPMPHAGTRRRRLHRLQPRAGAGRHPPRPLPPLAGRGQGIAYVCETHLDLQPVLPRDSVSRSAVSASRLANAGWLSAKNGAQTDSLQGKIRKFAGRLPPHAASVWRANTTHKAHLNMPHTRKEQLDEFSRILDILDELRIKCPWDRKQTNQSLRPNTIEEVYELSDALLHDDRKNICKELGDVLLHVLFYAKIGAEKGDFDIADVCSNLSDKLIFRHPHVFGTVEAETADQVSDNWEQLKQKEKDGNKTVLGGVPASLPSLIKAYRIQDKARHVGFDWEERSQVWDKVKEEIREFEREVARADADKAEAEFGDVLFSLVNAARLYGINPDTALERTNQKFTRRFNYLEAHTIKQGRKLTDMTLAEMDKIWDEAKRQEAPGQDAEK